MDNNTIHVMRLFMAWQDEDEEVWLREMSKSGLHLKKADLFGSYIFTRGEPREYIYRLDFRNEMKSDLKTYYQLFEEAGWEHVGVLGGWQYWRRPYDPADAGEIFTDPDSKLEKYRRLSVYLLVPLILLFSSTVNIMNIGRPSVMVAFLPIFAVIFVLAVYSEIRVYQRIQELKRL